MPEQQPNRESVFTTADNGVTEMQAFSNLIGGDVSSMVCSIDGVCTPTESAPDPNA